MLENQPIAIVGLSPPHPAGLWWHHLSKICHSDWRNNFNGMVWTAVGRRDLSASDADCPEATAYASSLARAPRN
jgi:hypothetical protein